ncbi:MAG: hypothetical protein BRD47_05225 [Bacteroidetes bacterium QS_8_68_28]|nr:MAG: hypothetical protein BRD47_05225 [Bacteroidetes bacterium QS_8_68_28]
MPSPAVPQSVREVLGEQASGDLATWFDESIRAQAVERDEFRKVLSRLDVLEERFDGVDDRLDRIDDRLNAMDERFDAMNTRMSERSEHIDEKLDRMNDRILSMTRWLIGLLVLFGTMVTVLLGIAQFTA